jgi:methylated-DNA-[protein]-cysteine S-methyltransferase
VVLKRYFAGEVGALDELDVEMSGTPFQVAAWQGMRKIEPGTTRSYAELADRVGAPRAVRAIGTACGRNPIGLVVPCHRVVRTDGGLGGYGWGLDRKRWLLDHEARYSGA